MKIYYYVVIIVGLMTLFSLAGIQTPTSYVLNTIGVLNMENFTNSSLYTTAIAIFLAVATGGLLIGFFTKTSPESYLLGTFMTSVLVLFIGDMISILSVLRGFGQNWVFYIVSLILTPLIVGYVIALIEFWRGTD